MSHNRIEMIQALKELAENLSDSIENKVFIKELMEIQGISEEEMNGKAVSS